MKRNLPQILHSATLFAPRLSEFRVKKPNNLESAKVAAGVQAEKTLQLLDKGALMNVKNRGTYEELILPLPF